MKVRVLVVILVLVVAGLVIWRSMAKQPEVASDTLTGNGTVEATEVDVTSQVPGKLISVAAHEGDTVRAGQPLAALEAAALNAQVQQAQEAVQAAQAQLQELTAGTRPEEIARARAQFQAARDARTQAQTRLDLAKAGPRREQIAQLRADLRRAQAAADSAETEYRRAAGLEEKGALPGQQADLARTQRDTAAAQAEAARQRLLEGERGTRPEDIAAARAAVAQADAQVKAAQAALELALAGPRSQTIAAARARVAQAQAALDAARVQRGYAAVTSPMNATVTLRNLEPGDFVSPGTPILRLAALDRVWVRVYVPETEVGRVKLGQRAGVESDTYPGKLYEGRVIEIAQKPEFTPKNVQTKQEREKLVFGVKIEVENPQHDLKPGLPVDAQVAVGDSGKGAHD